MKAGKSEVVCNAGRLIKVSKDKEGVDAGGPDQALDRLDLLLGHRLRLPQPQGDHTPAVGRRIAWDSPC